MKELFLFVFYKGARWLVRGTTRLFYSRLDFQHRERMNPPGPCIVIINHPSTLMDPLIVAARIQPHVKFLANGGLFLTKFNAWFFNTFYCIPVYRPIDTKGKKLNNGASFDAAIAHLKNKGFLFIAPEGTSYIPRRLTKLKTGLGRVAFAAEDAYDFNLNITVLPVGLSYTSATDFKSEVFVNVGELVRVADFKEIYEKDNWGGVRALTDHLAVALKKVILENKTEEEEHFTKCIEEMRRNEGRIDPAQEFHRSKNFIEQWRTVEHLPKNKSFQYAVTRYFADLKKHQFSDLAIKQQAPNLREWIGLIVGFPLFLLGAINNILPFALADFLERKVNFHISYAATARYLGGFVAFPIFYTIQTILVAEFTTYWWVYLLLLIPMGQFAWRYSRAGKLFLQKMRLQRLLRNKKRISTLLIKRRNLLLRQLQAYGF